MTDPLVLPPPPETAGRLREYLVETGYCDRELRKTLGIAKPPLQQFGLLDRLVDDTREPTPLHVLVRWFFLSRPVAADTARRHAPDWFLEACEEYGLLVRTGEDWSATCLIAPYGELLIASDLYAKLQSPERHDHVLSINPAAFNLVHFTVRREVERALDLGTGCGIQALLAARHARAVTATDLNPRATRYLEFNARLNDVGNIEALTGNLFEPVEGREYDLIVSNPPFVLAPASHFLYRDNEMELDGFCRHLARSAPGYLAEGGLFQMLCEWPVVDGQDWRERIGEWFEGTACDVWVMKTNVQEPSGYAEGRIRETLPPSDEAASAQFREWMEFYGRMKIREIHGGMVTMRRRSGRNWLRLEDRGGTVHGPFGEHVLTGLANRDFLESHPSDGSMMETRPRLVARTVLESQSGWTGEAWQSTAMRLLSSGGLRQVIGLDPSVAEFLEHLDGKHTLEELVRELNTRAEAEPARVREECVKTVRLLMERGFVEV